MGCDELYHFIDLMKLPSSSYFIQLRNLIKTSFKNRHIYMYMQSHLRLDTTVEGMHTFTHQSNGLTSLENTYGPIMKTQPPFQFPIYNFTVPPLILKTMLRTFTLCLFSKKMVCNKFQCKYYYQLSVVQKVSYWCCVHYITTQYFVIRVLPLSKTTEIMSLLDWSYLSGGWCDLNISCFST